MERGQGQAPSCFEHQTHSLSILPASRGQLLAVTSLWQAVSRQTAALSRVCWDSGAIAVALAALVFSISGLLVKLLGARVPVFEIVTFRSSISLVACAWAAHSRNIQPFWGHKQNFGFLLARGLCGAAAMTTYYVSIQKLPLADAVTLFFFNPAITAVAAWLILGEQLGLKGLAGVAVSVLGLILLTHPPFIFGGHKDWGEQRVIGTVFGIVSALCAAGAFLAIRLIGQGEPALVMSVYFHTSAFVSTSLPLLVGIPDKAVLPSWQDFFLLLGIAATSFWGQILIGRGFQLLHAAKASAINFTQVIYSYIFGLLFLHEYLNWLGVVGSTLIAAGVVLVNFRTKQSAKASTQESVNQAVQAVEPECLQVQPLVEPDLSVHKTSSANHHITSEAPVLSTVGMTVLNVSLHTDEPATACQSLSLPTAGASAETAGSILDSQLETQSLLEHATARSS